MATFHRRRAYWLPWSIAVALLTLGCQFLFGQVDVHDAKALLGECVSGEFRCNGEYLLSCNAADVGWSLDDTCASQDRCNSQAKRCDVCRGGDVTCVGAQRQQCQDDGSGWMALTPACASAGECSRAGCQPCAPGEHDCAGELQTTLRVCGEDGRWVEADDCATAELCSLSLEMGMTTDQWDGKCVAAGCPEQGKLRCDGARLQRCPTDLSDWKDVATCASDSLCAQVANQANVGDPKVSATIDSCEAACSPAGGSRCQGATLERCSDDQTHWEATQTCPAGTECNPTQATCGELCTPKMFQCNLAMLRQCDATQHWQDVKDCQTAALCSVSGEGQIAGACQEPVCKAGEFRCDGATLSKCRDDLTGFDLAQVCDSAALCVAADKICRDRGCPAAGVLECVGQSLRKCKADLTGWETVKTCEAGQYCAQDLAQPCKLECPKPQRCNGKVLEDCKPEGWVVHATCSTNDLCECTLNDPDGAGPLTHSCSGGLYKDGCGNVICGGVKAGYQCVGAELQKCQPGRNGWDDVSQCGSAALCYPGEPPSYSAGYCLTCPEKGELYCMGKTLAECSADRRSWNNVQSCTSYGCVAVQNGWDYCAACNTGQVQCAGAILQTCSSDRRTLNNTTCASAALCDSTNKQCDRCKANEVTCDGATLHTCSADGQTPTTTTCDTAGLCNLAKKRCEPPACKAGEAKCEGAQPVKCAADRTGFQANGAACSSEALCDPATATCRTCVVGKKRCDVAQPQTCAADGWQNTGTACASAALCVEGICSPPACAASDTDCDGAQPLACNASRTSLVAKGAACATAALCQPSSGTCQLPACAVGEPGCLGLQPLVCNAGRTALEPVGSACELSCVDGVCVL